jgi:F0F1-type ATP synthase membrane subunit c/vacuolar-type H+-ATPase subunit K
MKKKTSIFCSILFLLCIVGFYRTQAYSIGFTIDAPSQDFPAGSIVSGAPSEGDTSATSENTEYKLAAEYHSGNVVGVATDTPQLSLVGKEFTNIVYIMDTGDVLVRVSGENGAIASGDHITSSETPGVGVKATESGFALGQALENFTPQNESDETLLLVSLDIGFANIPTTYRRNLLEVLKQGISSPVMYPLDTLRYLLAAALVVVCIIVGMISFSKIASNSVQAIGRNPVAQKQIRDQTRKSFLLTALIIIVGLIIAYVILVA